MTASAQRSPAGLSYSQTESGASVLEITDVEVLLELQSNGLQKVSLFLQ